MGYALWAMRYEGSGASVAHSIWLIRCNETPQQSYLSP
jgi:hypothetical protein